MMVRAGNGSIERQSFTAQVMTVGLTDIFQEIWTDTVSLQI